MSYPRTKTIKDDDIPNPDCQAIDLEQFFKDHKMPNAVKTIKTFKTLCRRCNTDDTDEYYKHGCFVDGSRVEDEHDLYGEEKKYEIPMS